MVRQPAPIDDRPLRLTDRAEPQPGPGQIRVSVVASGVCRTDLHVAEGDLPPARPEVVPGHEVVGVVEALGPGAARFPVGARVGIPWLGGTCGTCRFCRTGRENLCVAPTFTGYHVDGGYAERAMVREDYAYALPEVFDGEHAAPLLCAGIIGYRGLRRANLPPGGRLGIYGFGGSAHLAAQVAIHEGAEVHVLTRSERARGLALELGAASARTVEEGPPVPLDAAVLFAPAGEVVPTALSHLDRGGTLSVAGIHLTAIPSLDYEAHLFQERTLTSTTANTRRDGEELLALAAEIPLRVETSQYPFEEADRALADLKHGRIRGAAVLRFA
jgi:alcohol dehydrogenase, propanol-preferring